MRVSLKSLKGDPNNPGLLVCRKCADERDPNTLPARSPENITIRRPSPDEKLYD